MNVAFPEDTATIGHRERKKLRTREALRGAALALFARNGFEQTTIEEIAAAVDIVPRTFFRYFPSKYDVLFDDVEHIRELRRDALRRRPAGEGALSAVLGAIDDVLDVQCAEHGSAAIIQRLSEQCAELRMRIAASRYESQVEMAEILTARLEPSDATMARMIVSVGMTAMWFAVDAWIADGSTHPLRRYADRILEKDVEAFRSLDSKVLLR